MSDEFQVISGDVAARAIPGWTVFADDAKEARDIAKQQQDRGGGRGQIAVVKMTPMCDHCGYRHRTPPSHLNAESYCREEDLAEIARQRSAS